MSVLAEGDLELHPPIERPLTFLREPINSISSSVYRGVSHFEGGEGERGRGGGGEENKRPTIAEEDILKRGRLD